MQLQLGRTKSNKTMMARSSMTFLTGLIMVMYLQATLFHKYLPKINTRARMTMTMSKLTRAVRLGLTSAKRSWLPKFSLATAAQEENNSRSILSR